MKKLAITALLIGFCLAVSTSRASASTFTVTKTADTSDGTCDADCSLREAVVAANANSGADEIDFNIPSSDGGFVAASGGTQSYYSLPIGLPTLTITDASGVFINGYSQTGSSRNTAAFGSTVNMVLKVQLTTSGTAGLFTITGGNNHITGLNARVDSGQGTSISFSTLSNNWLEGNLLGTDITGSSFSTWSNISMLSGSSNNVIGTNGDGVGDTGERNVIVINTGGTNGAINIQSGANNNEIIAGNYFGVNATGRVCGNGTMKRHQFIISGGTGQRVGTNFDGISDGEEANIISCISSDIRAEIRLSSTTGGVIQGNYIGTDPQKDDLLSSFAEPGITDNGAVSGWTIKRNTIAYNGSYGVGFQTAGSTGNTITQNSIFGNGGLGIDLGANGVTANDSGDSDTGQNDLMNFPVITKVVKDGSNLIVTANLDFKSSESPYTIEFFDNDALDSTGNGEGQYFVGSVSTTNIGTGVMLTVPITGTTPTTAARITATATNASGSTSEFSAAPSDPILYTANSAGIDLVNSITAGSYGKQRNSGTAKGGLYPVSTVEYSVNGSGWSTATPTDGSFDQLNDDFYADFLPTDNSWKGDGFTFKARARNNNGVWSNTALYFSPFNLNSPAQNGVVSSAYPTFVFSVNKQKDILRDNLSKYRLLVHKDGGSIPWQTVIENIPIEYAANNGSYETNDFKAMYTNESSMVSVTSKTKPLSGTYTWKIQAIDNAGHVEETDTRKVHVQAVGYYSTSIPLTLSNITGLGNPHLSSYVPFTMQNSFLISNTHPTFTGITFSGSTVTLTLTDISTDTTKTYTTIATPNSRFSITVPKGDILRGKNYQAVLWSVLGDKYAQVPMFMMRTR
ncbi:MAG TPA: CSLREA domain-containing protein [Patescibacteria group bacterium]|nr:CSLREA domain-containing protein [Patescibacteria group bacterium]